MMDLPKLDARLAALAGLVRPGVRVADIGTDHGYLISWLAASGKIPGGCACDIHKKPLENAAFSLSQYGIADRVELILCDGLQGVSPSQCEDIIIAGMGGDTIWGILADVPWTRCNRYQFLLQPMTKQEKLRKALYQNGFILTKEIAVASGNFCYCIMVSRYTGQKQEITADFAWGGLLKEEPSPEACVYIKHVCKRLETRLAGLRQSGEFSAEADECRQALSILDRQR